MLKLALKLPAALTPALTPLIVAMTSLTRFVLRHRRLVAHVGQRLGDDLGCVLVVIDDEDPHPLVGTLCLGDLDSPSILTGRDLFRCFRRRYLRLAPIDESLLFAHRT